MSIQQETIEAVVFTDEETQLIRALSEESAEISSLLPDHRSLDIEDAWEQLVSCLKIFKNAEAVSRRLRPIIGSVLLWARTHPEFYTPHGFATYDGFITDFVCGVMGLGRTTLYAARRVAERLPGLSMEELVELGPTKAGILAEATHSNNSDFPELLAKARNSTATALARFMSERNLIDSDSYMEQSSIILRCSKKVEAQWNEFVNSPQVQDYCGSSKPHLILEHMIQECVATWLDSGSPDICPQCNGSGRVAV
jgi:hypothetical protein